MTSVSFNEVGHFGWCGIGEVVSAYLGTRKEKR